MDRHDNEVTVEEVATPAQQAALDEYAARHRDATVYHLAQWRQVFASGLGYTAIGLLARRNDGRVAGCLTLFRVRALRARKLVAVPFRDRGGPLWDSPDALHALLGAAVDVARRERAAVLLLKTLAPFPNELARIHSFSEHAYWVRSLVTLEGMDRAGYLKAIGSKTRNMIRQSERAGLTIQVADAVQSLDDWYALHLATQQDLGVPPFPRRFFEALLRALAPSGALQLFLVRHAGKVAAGSIVLLHGSTAIYGYSASLPDARQHRPNDFLIFSIVSWLLERGYKHFDMGSDSPLQESLLFFKRKWQADQASIPTYLWGSDAQALNDSSDARYAAARQVLRRLPRPLYSLMGRIVTRYFG